MQTFFTTARIIVKHSDLSRPDSTLCVSSHRKKGRNSKGVSALACLTNLLTVNDRETDYGAFPSRNTSRRGSRPRACGISVAYITTTCSLSEWVVHSVTKGQQSKANGRTSNE